MSRAEASTSTPLEIAFGAGGELAYAERTQDGIWEASIGLQGGGKFLYANGEVDVNAHEVSGGVSSLLGTLNEDVSQSGVVGVGTVTGNLSFSNTKGDFFFSLFAYGEKPFGGIGDGEDWIGTTSDWNYGGGFQLIFLFPNEP